MQVTHPFEPIVNNESKILILGSFPSVKSREINFYYGHPQNRFWKVMARLFYENIPETIEEKKNILLRNNIAIWDILSSCEIEGSADASIKNPKVNDIHELIKNTNINTVFFNGNKAYELYNKYNKNYLDINIEVLPSTSPANATYSLDRLVNIWKEKIIRILK